jgi:hypothetical protein
MGYTYIPNIKEICQKLSPENGFKDVAEDTLLCWGFLNTMVQLNNTTYIGKFLKA